MLKYIRNDDVAADTTLHEIKTFCEICDRYGATPIHAITPIGRVRPISVTMDNSTIRRVSGTDLFIENREVVEYLKGRTSDKLALHGLWHTHAPTLAEISAAFTLMDDDRRGFECDYWVPPFNEGDYKKSIPVDWEGAIGIDLLGSGIPRIEDYLESGDPQTDTMYTHSWRYEHGPFTWSQLESCLKRLTRQ